MRLPPQTGPSDVNKPRKQHIPHGVDGQPTGTVMLPKPGAFFPCPATAQEPHISHFPFPEETQTKCCC